MPLAERDTVSARIVPDGVNAGHVGAFTLAGVSGRPDVLLNEGIWDTVTTWSARPSGSGSQRWLDPARRRAYSGTRGGLPGCHPALR
jgi:hypothetical protein